MDRRSNKRAAHYDPDSPPSRSRPRYNPDRRRRRPAPPPPFLPPVPPPGAQITTFYRILCPESKFDDLLAEDSVAQIQAQTHAWISVHRNLPGDSVRVIETSDEAVREPDGRPPQFSPAQDALIMLHRRIVDSPDLEEERDSSRNKVTSRMVIPKLHVGCLLGKGGKIIEQMRNETKTHIRVLPRDPNTPRCVSLSEEILQVAGDPNSVKRAIAVISDRLKESLHRDRSSFKRDRHFLPEEDFIPPNPLPPPVNEFNNNSNIEGRLGDFGNSNNNNNAGFSEGIVFRMLCPNNKVERGEMNGVFEMLRIEVGVKIRVLDFVDGSNETVIIVSSKEAPDDELFPAQEALLHIQSQIVDLGPDKDNVIRTRLLVPSKEISSFNNNNKDDDLFSEIKKSCFANVQVLPRDELPVCASDSDELIQIVGEIREARNALVQVTEKLRSFIYKDFYYNDNISPKELYYPQKVVPQGPWNHNKDMGPSASGSFEQDMSNISEETRLNNIKRFGVPMVARSTLDVIIPKGLVEILAMRSRNKLAQISEISGATVNLVEEINEALERVVRISGSPEQADKAQSLLQGFILSIQDDLPSS